MGEIAQSVYITGRDWQVHRALLYLLVRSVLVL
jgi:hypothetical protein